jgi:hypothetical protein
MNQRGPALVRIALLSLVLGAFALALVQPSLAGTPDAPEVQDPAGDVTVTAGTIPAVPPVLPAPTFNEIDILKGYVQSNNTTVKIVLLMAAPPSTAATAKYNATFNITTGTTVTSRSVQRLGTTVTGPVGTAATVSGNQINFTFPAASIGAVTGTSLTNLSVSTRIVKTVITGDIPTQDDQTGVDTAGPSTTSFVFNGPSPDDTDADGIPDDCEKLYFGNSTTAQSNPAADMDNDTLTLGEECALGTDPTNADSDSDGTNDKNDPFPTDSTKGGATSGTSTSTGTQSSTSSTSGSGTGTGTSSNTGTDNDESDQVKNLDDAVEKLKSDLDYLGTSAGGMIAVLILGILALAVRWSL